MDELRPRPIVLTGLRLGLLLPGRGIATPVSPAWFFLAFALLALSGAAIDRALAAPPRLFEAGTLADYALHALLALFAGWTGAAALRRPALWLTTATLLLFAHWPVSVALPIAHATLAGSALSGTWIDAAFALVVLGYLLRLVDFIAAGTGRIRRAATWGLLVVLWLAPVWLHPPASFWYAASDDSPEPDIDVQAVLQAQAGALDRALARLAPQTPGQVDLYAVGFAGDGHESVFRNEVEYFDALFAQRFAAEGRTLALINHPDTFGTTPLATLGNLQAALERIGALMDPAEDVLLLFLTSHGSDDHELLVRLGPLPMTQIAPGDLRDALDAAGIRQRVLIVSACYSGGFIPALEGPDSLVMTAARADRTSFGCGAASEITFFGDALLVGALNRTADFVEAFELARDWIGDWERESDITPSEPQIAVGERIVGTLARWRGQFTPGPEVAFAPAVPRSEPTPATAD